MALMQVLKCDCPNCGQVKSSDGWWVAIRDADSLTFLPLETDSIADMPLNQAEAKVQVLCSQKCAQRVLELFMTNMTNRETKKADDHYVLTNPAAADFESGRRTASYLDNYPRIEKKEEPVE